MLHGDTPILDPIDGTTLTIRERYHIGKKFYVYALKANPFQGHDVVIAEAHAPERHTAGPLCEVRFGEDGNLKVTRCHRLWNGTDYIPIEEIRQTLLTERSVHLLVVGEHEVTTTLNLACFPPPPQRGVGGIQHISRCGGECTVFDMCVPSTRNYYASGLFHYHS